MMPRRNRDIGHQKLRVRPHAELGVKYYAAGCNAGKQDERAVRVGAAIVA